MRSLTKIVSVAAWAAFLAPSPARAWGERGHHAAARLAAMNILAGLDASTLPPDQAALYKSLDAFFRQKAIQLGHISNIPDTAWRGLDPLSQAYNGPTHFTDGDHWTDNFDEIPLDYPSALAKFHGKPSRIDGKPIDLFETGTLIWRTQELYDHMVRELRKAAAATHLADQKADLQRALIYGGLMAHFVADASMPYHNTEDYDGFATGNGGVHSYFETDFPNTETPELEVAIDRAVSRQYKLHSIDGMFGKNKDAPGAFMARELSKQAFLRLGELRTLDDLMITERGQLPSEQNRKPAPAKRKSPEEAAVHFRPMVTEQVALSAAVLARLWRGAWEEAGKPDLSKAKFWDYAHKPDFIAPAYDPAALARVRKKVRDAQKKKSP